MSNNSEKKRARRRKQERARKEMEYDLSLDLKSEEDKREMQEIENRQRNKYADMAVMFFSTLALGYLILFVMDFLFDYFFGQALVMLGVSLDFIYPFFHAVIWIIAIVSVYRGRSVFDDLV